MRTSFLLSFVLIAAALSGCTVKPDDHSSVRAPIADYCPYVASPQSFTGGITLTGAATYQYRNDGNGAIVDNSNTFKPTISASTDTFTLTVNGTSASFSCSAGTTPCTLLNVVNGLSLAVNTALCAAANPTHPGVCSTKPPFYTHGTTAIDVYPTNGVDGSGSLTVTASGNMVAQAPRPIRYAEVQITRADGSIVQCTETDASGNFTTQIPGDGARYNVNVLARSSNSHNSAYVMNNPNDNVPYRITASVQSATSTSVTLKALAKGSMEGGAFNILDQINNAQDFLRTKTASCGTNGSGTFLQGCNPVTTIPLVYTYWTPGLTPNVYYGSSSPISFYLIGKRELYIGGGSDGDTTNSDMDQFDNSVIVHEYGHFVEDQFGSPNSPGGSHSGQYVIDPRLAWGEGWANFFQAAVSGVPMYRDTYGSVTCGSATCATGAAFIEPLENGTPYNGYKTDVPSVTGEGNFREFSVSRALWAIIQPAVSQFSEVWTALNGVSGMRVVNDPFKTVTRLHAIHAGFAVQTNKKDWSTPLTNELQLATFNDYATPLDLSASCSTSSITMGVKRDGSDDGSYSLSNQFRNNDFFLYNHTGGPLPVSLNWSGSGSVDLDLFIYRPGYVFGSSSSMAAFDNRDALGSTTGSAIATTGSASVNPNLPAGLYIINVMAATGSMTANVTASTTYSLSVANHAACPSP
jgi:hypothetical protein